MQTAEESVVPVQLFRIKADCPTCPTGQVLENLVAYNQPVRSVPYPGEPLRPDMKACLEETLRGVCVNHGCARDRCRFREGLWDAQLNEHLSKIYLALLKNMSETEAKALLESFTREGLVIPILSSAVREAGVEATFECAQQELKALWYTVEPPYELS